MQRATGRGMGGYDSPVPDPALIRFVRDVLGCGCPDEVLQSITVTRGRLAPEVGSDIARLDAGGQLLVYVVQVSSTEPLDALVPAALETGLGDRDGHGFNRFRLVLATADPGGTEAAAREAFGSYELPDDRVHLHVVSVRDCPRSLGES